jgi:hypothetical protein
MHNLSRNANSSRPDETKRVEIAASGVAEGDDRKSSGVI